MPTALTVEMRRDAERAIPEIPVPSLTELGLDHLRAGRRMQLVFALRPPLGLAAYVVLWQVGWWPAALLLLPLIYGWTLSAVHQMIHGSLGFGLVWRDRLLSALSMLVLESGHALEQTHLAHHGTDMALDDPEGYIELIPWRRMPIEAPLFRYRLWAWAWRQPGVHRPRMRVEVMWHLGAGLAAAVLGAALAFGAELPPLAIALTVYIGLINLANVAFAVMAGKGPQTNWGRSTPTPLIAVRGRLTRYLVFAHIWHLEHHLFPQIPLPLLGAVAERLDESAADVMLGRGSSDVLVVRTW